jgi:hypothetical protein
VARTVFQGDHDGRGLVSQNLGPHFFNSIMAGAWPVPEVTDIKTAARWPKSPGRGQPAGWGAPLGPLGGDQPKKMFILTPPIAPCLTRAHVGAKTKPAIIVFQGGGDGRGHVIEICTKYPGVPLETRGKT